MFAYGKVAPAQPGDFLKFFMGVSTNLVKPSATTIFK